MREKIAIVYIGLPRFEELSKLNHKNLINRLNEYWDVVEYNFLQPLLDRSTCPFPVNDTGAARIQVWDFYTALEKVEETIVLKMRSDIWFSQSSIDTVISELNLIMSGKQDISYMGCDTVHNFSEKNFKISAGKGKVLDLLIIVNKNKIRKKEIALADLQKGKLAQLKSGNSTFKVLTTTSSIASIVCCQIYIIRKDGGTFDDWHVGWNFLEYYLAHTVSNAMQWWKDNKDKSWL